MVSLGRENIRLAILESGGRVFLKTYPWDKKLKFMTFGLIN